MSLQWQWPREWDESFVHRLRADIQRKLRTAMSKNTNALLAGTPEVSKLIMGSAPPELTLREIQRITPEETTFVLHVRYAGDAQMVLKGLKLDIDTVHSTSADLVARDSYYPFEMTLCNIELEGLITFKLTHEIHRVSPSMTATDPSSRSAILPAHVLHKTRAHGTGAASSGAGGAGSHHGQHMLHSHSHGSLSQSQSAHFPPHNDDSSSVVSSTMPSVASVSSFVSSTPRQHRAGVAILGNKRKTPIASPPRQRGVSGSAIGSSGLGVGAGQAGGLSGAAHRDATPSGASDDSGATRERISGVNSTFFDVSQGNTAMGKRRLKITCHEGFQHNFAILSNFNQVVAGADSTVKSVLRKIVDPLMDRLKYEGIEVDL